MSCRASNVIDEADAMSTMITTTPPNPFHPAELEMCDDEKVTMTTNRGLQKKGCDENGNCT